MICNPQGKSGWVKEMYYFFSFLKKNCIGIWLFYCVVLVSAMQQSESALCTHMSPLF